MFYAEQKPRGRKVFVLNILRQVARLSVNVIETFSRLKEAQQARMYRLFYAMVLKRNKKI